MKNKSIRGWVYIITNKAMPNLVKVGFTLKDPSLRAKELSTTGIPYPYEVQYETFIEDPYNVEQKAHNILNEYREGKEWFRCSVKKAIAAIKQVSCGITILENSNHINQNYMAQDEHTFSAKCEKCKQLLTVRVDPKDRYVICSNCEYKNIASNFILNSFHGR